MNRSILFWVAAAGFSMAAHAQPPGRVATEEAAQPVVGSETRAWMALQKSGVAAPTDSRPMTGEVATRVYERYLESYSHPIPETFEREGFGTDGGQ